MFTSTWNNSKLIAIALASAFAITLAFAKWLDQRPVDSDSKQVSALADLPAETVNSANPVASIEPIQLDSLALESAHITKNETRRSQPAEAANVEPWVGQPVDTRNVKKAEGIKVLSPESRLQTQPISPSNNSAPKATQPTQPEFVFADAPEVAVRPVAPASAEQTIAFSTPSSPISISVFDGADKAAPLVASSASQPNTLMTPQQGFPDADNVALQYSSPLKPQPAPSKTNTPKETEKEFEETKPGPIGLIDPNFELANNIAPAEPAKTEPASPQDNELPHVLQGSKNFKLAEQPKMGEHFKDDRPLVDSQAVLLDPEPSDFSPGPSYDGLAYLGENQTQVYAGKGFYANQRPLVELGRPWYQLGQLSPGYNWFGQHNNIAPQFIIYGDYRTTVASNKANGDSTSLIASELNLDLDLKLTGTERFHAFVSPLDNGVRNTRYLLDEDRVVGELDANVDFGYFEGDLGAMAGGFLGETLPFDMPFAVGVMPLLFQNGVWMEDAFLGVAATIPARNSARFNISNMDVTFFAGYDKISSDAFPGDDSAARMYGMATFIEAMNGYFEIDYAFLDDRTFDDRSYHNIGLAYSRRYGRFLSNSTRVIINAGQSTDQVANTADGVLLLSENSLITGSPSSLVPYFNLFAGFDRPQSAARAAQAGGVLRNTGILFESDGMTDYPTLDPTANDTYGGAFGLNIIADDFSQQLVLEMAMLGVMGNDTNRNAPGEQLGIGFRYQLPLTNAILFRADGMYGFLDDQPDVRGLRFELRQKW